MRDADDRLGDIIAAVVRAGRALGPERLDGLLENIAIEVTAAMMEQDARNRSLRQQAEPTGTVVAFPNGPALSTHRTPEADDGES